MRIVQNGPSQVLVIESTDSIMLTTPNAEGMTCVYLDLVTDPKTREQKLQFIGGRGIVLIPPKGEHTGFWNE